MQVQTQQQIQESTSQQAVQQSTEQQIVQVSFFIVSMNYQKKKISVINGLHLLIFFPGADSRPAARPDAGSGPPSACWLPSATTRGDYCTTHSAWGPDRGTATTGMHTEQQQHSALVKLLILPLIIIVVLAASPIGSSCGWRSADPDPDSRGPLSYSAAGWCREKSNGNHSCHISRSRCPPASQKA